ncbi:hypothetical protein DBR32_12525 [Taibaiella sp. KBW10]|uniref:hypothetical protein n=1 Tax=Taibaiella sp. KBW10 TaxID=2153357 RepID=UPI000F5A1FE5|nr:hypothetical protein [Taibaiella sp. KBW10]RQO30388.1 hypothetical protein DBR32_12525 [Taibaiella sp. KBW10]
MRILLILTATFLMSINLFGQDDPLKFFYVIDSVAFKNNIRVKFDTLHNPPNQNTITKYDTLGRKILFYYTNSKFKYKNVYKTSADTILCFISTVSNENLTEKVIEIQKYLYNSNGKIIFKSNCYKNSNNISAQLTKFYYDSLNRITAKHFYYVHNFSKELNDHYSTNEASYELNTAENYFYDNKNRLILIKEMTGPFEERYTDSLKYDNQGRLKTIIKFQKYGSIGEIKQRDIFYTTNYVYSDSSWTKYESVCVGEKIEATKGAWKSPTIEYVFSENGLLIKEYMVYDNSKELHKKYDYQYFK